MWEWIVIGLLYAVGLLFFQLLGGLSAAAGAIQNWGRVSSERRRDRVERWLAAVRARRDAPWP